MHRYLKQLKVLLEMKFQILLTIGTVEASSPWKKNPKQTETFKRSADEAAQSLHGDDPGSDKKQPMHESSSVSRVYAKRCIFCEKVTYIPRTHSRETLTQAAQLRADETLWKAAVKKGDTRLIALTSREIVAAEAHTVTGRTLEQKIANSHHFQKSQRTCIRK